MTRWIGRETANLAGEYTRSFSFPVHSRTVSRNRLPKSAIAALSSSSASSKRTVSLRFWKSIRLMMSLQSLAQGTAVCDAPVRSPSGPSTSRRNEVLPMPESANSSEYLDCKGGPSSRSTSSKSGLLLSAAPAGLKSCGRDERTARDSRSKPLDFCRCVMVFLKTLLQSEPEKVVAPVLEDSEWDGTDKAGPSARPPRRQKVSGQPHAQFSLRRCGNADMRKTPNPTLAASWRKFLRRR